MYSTYHPTTRILAVLELLQTHGLLTGADLAARLEVDGRSVRRYVTTLQDIGVPIEAVRGRHGGYRLRPGFRLPPLMFTEDEALAVTLGLMAYRRLALPTTAPAAESALAKIGRVLPIALRDRVGALVETVEVATSSARADGPSGPTMLALGTASHACRQVRLRYQSARGEVTERTLDPYGLVVHEGRWYTVGWDHLRGEVRVFRADRIVDLTPTDEPFTRPPGFRALEHVIHALATAPWHWDVEVVLGAALAQAHERVPAWVGSLEETSEGVVLYARAERLDGMARFLADLGWPFVVRRPAELRAELRRLAAFLADQAAHEA